MKKRSTPTKAKRAKIKSRSQSWLDQVEIDSMLLTASSTTGPFSNCYCYYGPPAYQTDYFYCTFYCPNPWGPGTPSSDPGCYCTAWYQFYYGFCLYWFGFNYDPSAAAAGLTAGTQAYNSYINVNCPAAPSPPTQAPSFA